MVAVAPNFALLDSTRPDIAHLVLAMLQARDAVERRSWSHPQEPTGEEWWADVLADPRARISKRRSDYTAKRAFYRLADEKREIMNSAVKRNYQNARAFSTRQAASNPPNAKPKRCAILASLITLGS